MSSTTTQMDKDDHPYLFFVVNTTLWLCMFIFVALPFGIVSALLLAVLRPISFAVSDMEVAELVDFLELCQLMPEICIAQLLAGSDFVRCLDGRVFVNVGTPV